MDVAHQIDHARPVDMGRLLAQAALDGVSDGAHRLPGIGPVGVGPVANHDRLAEAHQHAREELVAIDEV